MWLQPFLSFSLIIYQLLLFLLFLNFLNSFSPFLSQTTSFLPWFLRSLFKRMHILFPFTFQFCFLISLETSHAFTFKQCVCFLFSCSIFLFTSTLYKHFCLYSLQAVVMTTTAFLLFKNNFLIVSHFFPPLFTP